MYKILLVFFPVILFAQEDVTSVLELPKIEYQFFDNNVMHYYDGRGIMEQSSGQMDYNIKRKSPLLAGAMSLTLPGTGEIYSGHYLRGAIHLAVEAAGWVIYFIYQDKGDNQTIKFERFADENWSVVKYAQWLNDYWLNGWDPIYIDPDASKHPWERVNWDELNAFERRIPVFSHTLEPFGTQQYYELIGKYTQFNRGWGDSNPHPEIDIERELYFTDVSSMFSGYSSMRGRANTYYARSHNAIMALFVNHVISAFHAAFLAHRYNELHFSFELETRETLYGTRSVPTLHMSIGF